MLITLTDVSKSFGSDTILKNVSLRINSGARIGLIGLNGSGKSTLLKMIAGDILSDSGNISVSSSTDIGFLRQHLGLDESLGIYEETLKAFSDVIEQEKQLEKKRIEIENSTDLEKLTKLNAEFLRLSESFAENKGYYYKGIVSATLKGLGFGDDRFDEKISTLSGGQKMRVALAKMLIEKPDLLLLDEPTNYLDVSGIAWLENYLLSYPNSYIIVSHDRYFLDKTVTTIWEADGTVKEYNGNYSAYLVQRESELYAQNRAYEIQSDYIKKQREVIRRLKSYNREKSVKRAESREKQLKKIELIEKPKAKNKAKISFETQKVISKNAIRTIALKVGYDGKALVSDIDIEIMHGTKLGICGNNATGKTTFLRTIYGELKPVGGEIIYGAGVLSSYFKQYHDDISRDVSVLDELCDYSGEDTLKVRSVLAGMLFTDEEVFKNISVLSGGELARVAVAKLMLTKANLLLLDEPTNHLDISSKEIFEQAIRDFEGTVFVVSHDRYLLSQVCDNILYIDGGKAYFYDCPYDAASTMFAEASQNEKKAETHEEKQKPSENEGLSKNEIRRAHERIGELEKLMSENENKKAFLEKEINAEGFYSDALNSQKTLEIYNRALSEHDELENEWLELTYKLENSCE